MLVIQYVFYVNASDSVCVFYVNATDSVYSSKYIQMYAYIFVHN